MLLVLIIYYLISLTNALREANQDLKMQLRRERTEERRKMFKISMNNRPNSNQTRTLSNRWKKVLENSTSPNLPPGANQAEIDDEKIQARKELLARIMRKALRKGSATSEDDSNLLPVDDGTDNEQHESLPHDQEKKKEKVKRRKQKPAKIESSSKPVPGNAWINLIKTVETKEKPAKLTVQPTNVPIEKPKPIVISKSEGGVNFKLINEKLISKPDTQPEVFKFDEVMKTLQEEQKQKKENEMQSSDVNDDYISDDASSYREIKINYPENLTQKKLDVVEPNLKPTESTAVVEKLTKEQKPLNLPKEAAPKGMKKLNSFLALVREAVQNKKSEIENQNATENVQSQSSTAPAASTTRKPLEKTIEMRRNSKKPNPSERSTKRQDSSSSIWSENIPVITISKTESEECILDENRTNEKHKVKENVTDKK